MFAFVTLALLVTSTYGSGSGSGSRSSKSNPQVPNYCPAPTCVSVFGEAHPWSLILFDGVSIEFLISYIAIDIFEPFHLFFF